MTTALRVQDVSGGYGKNIVINDVTLQVEEKEAVSIIGPNGAGKTTLLSILMGEIQPVHGQILFYGRNLVGFRTSDIVANGLGLVPQARGLFPNMSVDENLLMGCYLTKDRKTIRKKLDSVYSLFPILKDRHNQLAKTMSGGQAQMLTIARTLLTEPKMLLLDEPSSGLAPSVVDDLYSAIYKLKAQGFTLLIVEQDVSRALTVTDRAYVLQRGRIVMHDSSDKLQSDPDLVKHYLTSY